MDILEALEASVESCGIAPLMGEMPRRSLLQKGLQGPTAAHVIEEIHTPLNLAGTTYTTGSSAIQTPVGITYEELTGRMDATAEVLRRAEIHAGSRLLVSYAPLINVFWGDGLKNAGVDCFFPLRSSRDAVIAAICRQRPDAVAGESSFLRAALEDCEKMGLSGAVPENLVVLAAGTPLDMGLLEVAEWYPGMKIHDLYGCQEFGWLALDGVPVRDDIRLVPCRVDGFLQVSCGGLLTGDMFPVKEEGHILNPAGSLLTYGRRRTPDEWESVILSSVMSDEETVRRAARSILRLKSRVVRVSDTLETRADRTCVGLYSCRDRGRVTILSGPEATGYLDTMIESQSRYQREKKNDPSWLKKR